jgi:type IV pilus assembly protein PilC
MLYAAGIPVLSAMESTRKIVGNRPVEMALAAAGESINEGRSISESFRQTGLFPPLILRMLHVGETTGGLDHALRNVAYFYHRDIRESVSKAQTLIEPALTLIMGLLLGWIMLSVIGPIYDVITRIKL